MSTSSTSNVRPMRSGPTLKAMTGYTPVPSSIDEANTRVVIKLGPTGMAPIQDPSVFTKINELADELRVLENGAVVLNLAKGFRTITDFYTYTVLQNPLRLTQIIQQMHELSCSPKPLVSIDPLIAYKKQNLPEVDLAPLIEVLLGRGFLRVVLNSTSVQYVRFNNLNLPCESVELNLYANMRTGIVTGVVIDETFQEIKIAFEPNQQPLKERIVLKQLDSYKETHPGGPIHGEFTTLALSDDMDYALPEFYPWIKMGLHDYFAEFLNSRANVLVLIGPPGTGKSTLIRTMIRDLNIRSMLAYKPDVVASEHFIKTCQEFLVNDHDDMMSHYHARNSGIPRDTARRHNAIVVEDADLIMAKRSDGNHRMSEILNATSGIASDTHSKFILSTNLKDADAIDPALLRPGRCFDILCFRDLSADEASTVRQIRGLEPRDFATNRRYKLAEALNDSLTHRQVEPVVKPRFGF